MVRSFRVRHPYINRRPLVPHQPNLELLEDRLPPGSLFVDFPTLAPALPDARQAVSSSNGLPAGLEVDSFDSLIQYETKSASIAVAGSASAESKPKAAESTAEFTTPDGKMLRRSSVVVGTRSGNAINVTPVGAPPSATAIVAPPLSPALADVNPVQVSGDASQAPSASSTAAADFGNLSLYFEANLGQIDSPADYIGKSAQYTVHLSSDQVIFNLPPAPGQDTYSALRMQIVGANPNALPTEGKPLDGKVNYFLGADPTEWYTCIPTLGQVSYADVYPGVDAVYYANGSQLEYDFVVRPGANPNAIAVKFEGAQRLELEADGDLVVDTGLGEVVQHKPTVYQEINGTRSEVSSRYVVQGDTVAFDIGAYDASRPLVIDPVVQGYSTFLGASSADQGSAIAVDHTGSAYITGRTGSNNFPATGGVVQTGHGGGNDGFVARLTPDGSGLVYATYLGGALDDYGQSIAVDRQGNAYVIGATGSQNFPVTGGAFQQTNGGNIDAFVAKLSANGTNLLYSTYLGGVEVDQGNGIDVNRNTGVAFVTGATVSPTFPTTTGAFQTTHGGGSDVFVTALNAAGTGLVYSTFIGGSEEEIGNSLAVDGLNRVSVTGQTRSLNFPVTPGAFQTTFGGGTFDAFVARIKPDGASLGYATYLGGADEDRGNGVAHTGVGQVYITGFTSSAVFPTTPGAFQTASGGASDAFVTSLSLNGKTLVYSTLIGGTGADRGTDIVIDSAGRAYISGFAGNATYPTTPDALQGTYAGASSDALFTQVAANGASLVYSTFHGGAAADLGFGIAIDRLGNIYLTGNTISANLPTSTGAYQTTKAASNDAFAIKYTISAPAPIPAARPPLKANVQPAIGG